ncbi:cryptic plasmid protein A [Chromobacterium phragmitis]|uniref:cryptic plasmid protein A n=1 Tax=Chromobacterium phragmitis TaxID=2202141 RepID=UPI0011AE4669|nr:cryptic plasmid protein A [Chromobacterium phragmitis]
MKTKVLVLNERDARSLEWLAGQVGESAVEAAVSSLSGRRQPYVSNIAKVLGLELPDSLVRTPSVEARRQLARIKVMLDSGAS